MESYSVPIQFEESDTEYESDDSDSKYDGLDSIERFELDYDDINNTCQKYLKVLFYALLIIIIYTNLNLNLK